MSELNPNHEVTTAMRGQWHKIVAVMMHKQGHTHQLISREDLLALSLAKEHNVVVREREGMLHISLVDDETAEKLARSEGGLPA